MKGYLRQPSVLHSFSLGQRQGRLSVGVFDKAQYVSCTKIMSVCCLDTSFWWIALFCEQFSPLAFKDIRFNGMVKQLV